MATVEELSQALKAADRAGNEEDARKLAQALGQLQPLEPVPDRPASPQGIQDRRTTAALGVVAPEAAQRREEVLETPTPRRTENQLREQGIETRAPTPEGVSRGQLSFAPTEEDRLQAAKQQLSESLGQDVEVRRGAQGDIEFRNPETGRFQLLDPRGADPGDISDLLGVSFPVTGEIVGGIVGSAASPVLGTAAGAAAGAAIGETARRRLGGFMGVGEETGAETAAGAAREGALAGLFGLGGGGAAKFLNRFIAGPTPIKPDEAQRIIERSRSADEVIQGLRDEGFDVRPTAGQRTGDPVLQRVEASARAVDPQSERQFFEQGVGSEQELERFFRERLGVVGDEIGSEQAGRQVQQDIRQRFKPRVQQERRQLETLRGEEREAVDRLPAFSESSAGGNIREILEQQGQRAKQEVDEIWSEVNQLAGVRPRTNVSDVKIPLGQRVREQTNRLVRESDESLFQNEAISKRQLVRRLEQKKRGEPVDLVTMNSAISHLRRQIRVSGKGLSADEPGVGDAKQLLKSLVRNRNQVLSRENPELLEKLQEAELATRLQKNTFDRGLVGKVLQTGDDGVPVLSDQEAFRRLVSGSDPRKVVQVADALSGDAKALRQLKENMRSHVRRQIADEDGTINPTRARRFVRENEDMLKGVFGAKEVEEVKRTGQLGDMIRQQENRLKQTEKAFQDSLAGQIDRLNSEAIVPAIFSTARTQGAKASLSIDDTRKLKRILDKSPQVRGSIQNSIRDEIRRRAMSGERFEPQRLTDLLERTGDASGRGKLSNLLGDQYVQDLKKLRDALQIQRRGGQPFPSQKEADTTIGLLRRMTFGQLDPTSFRAGVSKRFQMKAARRAIANALTDETVLRELAESGAARFNTERGATLMSILGLPELRDNAENPPSR